MDNWIETLYDTLPQTLVVHWRANRRRRPGFSCSLAYTRAKILANRLQKNNAVVSGLVNKDQITSLGTRFGAEVIVSDSSSLKTIESVSEFIRNRERWITDVLRIAEDSYALGRISYHGPWHWEKVEYNAIKICEQVEHADPLVARLFAILHDCRRRNEHRYPEHGARAGEFARHLSALQKLKINKEQLDTLEYALRYHSDGEVSEDPTIGVCWDADRLDLIRVWMIPDPEFLSTEAAKRLLWRI